MTTLRNIALAALAFVALAIPSQAAAYDTYEAISSDINCTNDQSCELLGTVRVGGVTVSGMVGTGFYAWNKDSTCTPNTSTCLRPSGTTKAFELQGFALSTLPEITAAALGVSGSKSGAANRALINAATAQNLTVHFAGPMGAIPIDDEIVLDRQASIICDNNTSTAGTVFQTAGNGKAAVVFGKSQPAQFAKFIGCGISGTSADTGGIRLGTNGSNYAANIAIEGVRITGFTNGYGLQVAAAQLSTCKDCVVTNNLKNFHRPDTNGTYMTTMTLSGQVSDWSTASAGGECIAMEGTGTLFLDHITTEDCPGNGISIKAPTNNLSQGQQVHISHHYFEANNQGGSGSSDIYAEGYRIDGYNATILTVTDSEFHPQAHAMKQLSVDKVNIPGFNRNTGFAIGSIQTTANTRGHMEWNALAAGGAANSQPGYAALPGSISVIDKDDNYAVYQIKMGTVAGSGTATYVPIFTDASTLGNSGCFYVGKAFECDGDTVAFVLNTPCCGNGAGNLIFKDNGVQQYNMNVNTSDDWCIYNNGGSGAGNNLCITKTTGDVSVPVGKLRVTNSYTPASSTAACAAGTTAWDTSYVYVCTATNTWKRAALTSW